MATLVADMLRSLGHKDIREVTDADSAMFELRRRAFEMIILDDALDGMDGVALTRNLRAATDSPNRSVPIIMMSSAPDAKRIAAARDSGVTVVAALHDLNIAAQFCDTLLVLVGGRVVGTGTPEQVLVPANLRAWFDIDAHIVRHPRLDVPQILFDERQP
ncbi:MAG TPA: hypothetical protein DIW80_15605 [Gordonia polyisoprenivorans]|nr:hypothetical protein [Gordonia polyisoprenivorans]